MIQSVQSDILISSIFQGLKDEIYENPDVRLESAIKLQHYVRRFLVVGLYTTPTVRSGSHRDVV